jgi:hypothetical protein
MDTNDHMSSETTDASIFKGYFPALKLHPLFFATQIITFATVKH